LHLRHGTNGEDIDLGGATQLKVGNSEQAATAAVDMVRLRRRRQQAGHESSVLGELTDAVVSGVGDDDPVAGVDRDSLRPQQTSVGVTAAGDTGNQLTAGWIKQLQSVVAGVSDDDATVRVRRDEVGHAQLGVLSTVRAKLRHSLTPGTVDTNLLTATDIQMGTVCVFTPLITILHCKVCKQNSYHIFLIKVLTNKIMFN